jgi:hypothetical protein
MLGSTSERPDDQKTLALMLTGERIERLLFRWRK